ncbi:MAG: type 4a pilus biogenesis protein PilO [Acidimicrobiales bacterium]|nr:type 4a pilus biogenesis protein PilO [Acidimicrobiales bacterium]
MPLLIGVGALVVGLLIWLVLIAPQNSKLSSLQAKESTLNAQQTDLQAKLSSLRSEKQSLSAHCADLQKIVTQIPSVQSPTDVDAEESSFEGQLNALAGSSGVTLAQFSGFAPASASAAAAPAATHTGAATPADVTPVPTTLTVTGNYGQVSSFINGLDNFPRLFVIQNFTLSTGTGATTSGSSSSSSASAAPNGTPLWTGGTPTPASAGPYSVNLTGSIYYTSSPNALDACTKAAETLK